MVIVAFVSGQRLAQIGSSPQIGDLRGELDAFEEAALGWQPDARLVSAEMYLSNNPRRRMGAEYASPTASRKRLFIVMAPNGSLGTEVYSVEQGVTPQLPLGEVDWNIGSQEAVRRCLMSSAERENSLSIYRDTRTGRVVWQLDLPDCPLAASHRYYLDAETVRRMDSLQD